MLPNIETYLLDDEQQREYVLDRLEELVVKAVGESEARSQKCERRVQAFRVPPSGGIFL